MCSGKQSGWRADAARIVEELFPVTRPSHWDQLLDLRGLLLVGSDWRKTLDVFCSCRKSLEEDHYLPFYRLRRLLAVSLRLEAVNSGLPPWSLEELLQKRHRSFADIEKRIRRDCFELTPAGDNGVAVRVVEVASAIAI